MGHLQLQLQLQSLFEGHLQLHLQSLTDGSQLSKYLVHRKFLKGELDHRELKVYNIVQFRGLTLSKSSRISLALEVQPLMKVKVRFNIFPNSINLFLLQVKLYLICKIISNLLNYIQFCKIISSFAKLYLICKIISNLQNFIQFCKIISNLLNYIQFC